MVMVSLSPGITVVTPTIPPRGKSLLPRAIGSAARQTHPVSAYSIAVDTRHDGAGPTRTRACEAVRTEWIALLDDDDQWYPKHIETLVALQRETDADVVWPWFEVLSGADPFPMHRGRQWDPDDPHSFPITTLLRTELVLDVGAFGYADQRGEDFTFFIKMSNAGAVFAHTPEVTWSWDHASGNTSGDPTRWQ